MEISSKQMCDDILALVHKFKTSLADVSDAHGLTLPQFHALYAIQQGRDTMGRAASSLHCDASNMTGIIDRLVAQQLVTREEDPEDRRTKVLRLTNKGRELLETVASQLPSQLGCTTLTAQERSSLHALIVKLVR